ncbi:MAG: hypothetical protein JXN64_05280 [Spirochaetes bacterium]|nr:hypothetical protein [Spirochaetota bacterium]
MDDKERIALIRKGNEFFNNGDIDNALKIFVKTDYKDGLIRIGDYYYYEKRQPLTALGFYQKANVKKKVDEIFERMMYALNRLIVEDKNKDKKNEQSTEETIQVNFSPKLQKVAEEILKKNRD